MAGVYVASTSFADDVALVGTSWAEVELLVAGYQQWCRLLGIHIHVRKTQVWTSQGAGHRVVL